MKITFNNTIINEDSFTVNNQTYTCNYNIVYEEVYLNLIFIKSSPAQNQKSEGVGQNCASSLS